MFLTRCAEAVKQCRCIFQVSAMEANVPYRFNIVNCEKVNSQFNFGKYDVVINIRYSGGQ